MKSFIISIAIAALAAQSLSAQTAVTDTAKKDSLQHRKNSWYAEFLGASLLGTTFNYERFIEGHPWGLSVHAGIGGGIIPELFSDNVNAYAAIPLGVSYNIPVTRNKRGLIEIGGTYTFLPGLDVSSWGADQKRSIFLAVLSWRWESPAHLVQFRATIYPSTANFSDGLEGSKPWIGFSIGKKF